MPTVQIVVPKRAVECFTQSPSTSSISRNPRPCLSRVPPIVRFRNGSYTLPTQFVTTMAPTVHGPTFAALLPSPPLVPPLFPKKGPTVAPVPAPPWPCVTGLVDAFMHAAYPRLV